MGSREPRPQAGDNSIHKARRIAHRDRHALGTVQDAAGKQGRVVFVGLDLGRGIAGQLLGNAFR